MKPQSPAAEPWEGSGVPPWRAERLLYSRSAETLVVVMYRKFEKEAPVRQLYYRRLPKTTYEPVDVRHKLESHEHAHCCEEAPFLIFNEMRFEEPRPTPEHLKVIFKEKDLPPERWAADWIGIRRVNLKTGEDTRVLDELSFNPPPPYISGWVSDILSVSADGTAAVCVVGLDRGGRMDYSVFEVSFAEGLKRKIADLPHTFL
jgi:hypothetical protein